MIHDLYISGWEEFLFIKWEGIAENTLSILRGACVCTHVSVCVRVRAHALLFTRSSFTQGMGFDICCYSGAFSFVTMWLIFASEPPCISSSGITPSWKLAIPTTVMPTALINLASGRKTISFIGCLSQIFFYFFLGTVDFFLLTVMAFDRYVAICNPLRYTTIMNDRFCRLLVPALLDCGVWVCHDFGPNHALRPVSLLWLKCHWPLFLWQWTFAQTSLWRHSLASSVLCSPCWEL